MISMSHDWMPINEIDKTALLKYSSILSIDLNSESGL